jgi:hypothetical protein
MENEITERLDAAETIVGNRNPAANALMGDDWNTGLTERVNIPPDGAAVDLEFFGKLWCSHTVILKKDCEDSEQSVKFHERCPPIFFIVWS